MTRIELLRHGATEGAGGFRGSLDEPLSEQGWMQMHAAVEGAGPWDLLVSSPLQRCRAFAETLAAQRDLPLRLEADLRELHFGDWEGWTAAQLMERDAQALQRFWEDPYGFTPPGAEPMQDFERRVLAAVQRLRDEHPGQRLLLIGHGGPMRLLLAQARGLPRERLLEVVVGHGELHSLTQTATA